MAADARVRLDELAVVSGDDVSSDGWTLHCSNSGASVPTASTRDDNAVAKASILSAGSFAMTLDPLENPCSWYNTTSSRALRSNRSPREFYQLSASATCEIFVAMAREFIHFRARGWVRTQRFANGEQAIERKRVAAHLGRADSNQ